MLQEISEKLSKTIEIKRKKEKLQRDLSSVSKELKDTKSRLDSLSTQLEKEKIDVDKLEGTSLKGLFYSVLGSREQQLDKERQEMLSAQLKYQQTRNHVEFLKRDREYLRQQIDPLAGVDAEYERLLAEKERLLHQTDEKTARQLMEITEKIAELEAEIKEITEAIHAGNQVVSGLRQVISSLKSAEGWGTWDLLGGEFISTAVKHSRIDEARNGIHDVQTKMSQFSRELADVRKHVEVQIDIGALASFADFFFDGLIADWVVQSRIRDSLNQTIKAQQMVEKTVDELEGLKNKSLHKIEELREQRTRLIERS